VHKRIKDLIDGVYDAEGAQQELKAAQEGARYEAMSEKQLSREIRALEKQMLDYARNLEFEKAAKARDDLSNLKRRVFGIELHSE
jgi:excinuclease ABC subunit B